MIMENILKKSVYLKSVLVIFIMAIVTAILQGNPYTSVEAGADRQLQIVLFFALSLGSVGLCYREYLAGLLSTEKKIIWTVAFGTLVRMFYVLFMNCELFFVMTNNADYLTSRQAESFFPESITAWRYFTPSMPSTQVGKSRSASVSGSPAFFLAIVEVKES